MLAGSFPWPYGFAAAMAVIVLALCAARSVTKPLGAAGIELLEEGKADLLLPRGGRRPGHIDTKNRYVSRWLVVLFWQDELGVRTPLLFAPDSVTPTLFRQLSLWALWGRWAGARPAGGAKLTRSEN